MQKQIVFKVDLATGKMSVEANGFKGPACLKMTDKLLEGLNSKVVNRKLKQEYNQIAQADKIAIQE